MRFSPRDRMKNVTALALLSLLLVVPAGADDQSPCPCVPLSPTWTVSACETWNCASAALVNANGDPNTFALPTRSDTFKWIVVQRVNSGTSTTSGDGPFLLDHSVDMSDAIAKFVAIDKSFAPIIVNVTDGNFLIIRLRDPLPPRRRAVSH
jgi:hypothetical protein